MKKIILISAMIVAVTMAGCRIICPSGIPNSPEFQLTMEAAIFVGLLEQNKYLEGLAQEKHGVLQTPQFDSNNEVTYPFTVMLNRTVENSTKCSYRFELLKDSKTDPWRLIKWWRIDIDKTKIEEMPIPDRAVQDKINIQLKEEMKNTH